MDKHKEVRSGGSLQFHPENLMKAVEHVHVVARVHQDRLIFGDEKALKAKEILNRRV